MLFLGRGTPVMAQAGWAWAARGHTSNLWLLGEGGQVVFEEPKSTWEVAQKVHKPLAPRIFIVMLIVVGILGVEG